MTRDDYKVKDTMIFEESQEDSINSIIDNIFDDFESRTCNSCKYFTSSPNTNKYDCCEKGISDTSISFCCNKWEVIDEK